MTCLYRSPFNLDVEVLPTLMLEELSLAIDLSLIMIIYLCISHFAIRIFHSLQNFELSKSCLGFLISTQLSPLLQNTTSLSFNLLKYNP